MTDLTTAAKRAREWTERRDALICDQRRLGLPLRTIAAEAGLSHSAIAKIVARSSVT